MIGGKPDAKETVLHILRVADLFAATDVSANLDQHQNLGEKYRIPNVLYGLKSGRVTGDTWKKYYAAYIECSQPTFRC